MKIDCSITENFFKEWHRMCATQASCGDCLLNGGKGNIPDCMVTSSQNIKYTIEKVQTWSDKNQPEIDWNKVPIDTLVLVNDGLDDEWLERYFAMYLPDGYEKFCVFADGATYENAKTVSCWKKCKLADDADLTPFWK